MDEKKFNLAVQLNNANAKMLVGLGIGNAYDHTPNMVVLYADVGKRFHLDEFQRKGGYCLDVGIAEQNLIGVAAGMCHEGYTPVAIAYAPFIVGRVFDQIKANVGEMQLPLILVGGTSGLSGGDLGPLSMCTDDIAMLRTIPGLTIVSPADGVETVKCFVAAVQAHAPIYIRMTGKYLPAVYHHDYTFVLGKAVQLREGTRILAVANGAVTANVLAAADRLAAEGHPIAVLNMHTIKPLDTAALEPYLNFEAIITVEEHSIYGGLGSAVAEYLVAKRASPVLYPMGINDRYFVADHYQDLLEDAGLSAEKIYQALKNLIARPAEI